MSWSRAALHWLVAAALAIAFFASGRSRGPEASRPAPAKTPVAAGGARATGEADARARTETGADGPRAAASPAQASAHATAGGPGTDELPSGVTRIRISRGDLAVAWRREADATWKVEAPAGKSIPPGLLAAFAEQLDAVREGERLEAPGPDADFGLDHPSLRIEWSGPGDRRGTILVGGRTPTGTAWYGRVGADGAVRIVGSNLVYYADLVLGAAR